jgi:uncharacterized membrane protein
VRRWALLCGSLILINCSNLTEGAGGVVGLEVSVPTASSVEVGEALQLSARALDRDGQTLNIPISWRAADPTLTVDEQTGIVTGVAPGTGRVQAFVGSLASDFVSLTVLARADTISIVGDSIVTVDPAALASTPLVVQVQSFTPAGPAASRPVVYTITSPPEVVPHVVELPGGVLSDTLLTASDGTIQGITLNRVAGVTSPDSAIVVIRSYRASGADVPGSGQRFIVRFP